MPSEYFEEVDHVPISVRSSKRLLKIIQEFMVSESKIVKINQGKSTTTTGFEAAAFRLGFSSKDLNIRVVSNDIYLEKLR